MRIQTMEMSSQKPNPGARNYFSWLMVGCAMVLFLIWPVKHTIALRIFLLAAGGMMSLVYIVRERSCLFQKSALPLLLLFLFFVWLITQYFFFSHNRQLELLQIQGTWLRVLLACFLGIGTGLFARQHRGAQLTILAGILSFLVLTYLDYFWVGYTYPDYVRVAFANSSWTIPYHFELGFLGYKTTAVFYGITSLALVCGVISFQLRRTSGICSHILLACIVGIGLIFLMFVITGTKNGVAIGLLLIFCILVSFLTRTRKSFKSISAALILLVSISLMSYWHLKLNPEWGSVLSSVEAGMQIDRYSNWKDDQTYGLPKLADGTSIGESAYLRTAYVIEGLKLLLENPLGYGAYDKSFRYLADEDSVLPPQSPVIATHCGWLDFSLGLGIPGLLLIWSAFALAFISSFRQKSLWSYVTRWMLAGIFITWMLSEICNNHHIETLFYLIALLAAGNIPISERIPQAVSEIRAGPDNG